MVRPRTPESVPAALLTLPDWLWGYDVCSTGLPPREKAALATVSGLLGRRGARHPATLDPGLRVTPGALVRAGSLGRSAPAPHILFGHPEGGIECGVRWLFGGSDGVARSADDVDAAALGGDGF